VRAVTVPPPFPPIRPMFRRALNVRRWGGRAGRVYYSCGNCRAKKHEPSQSALLQASKTDFFTEAGCLGGARAGSEANHLAQHRIAVANRTQSTESPSRRVGRLVYVYDITLPAHIYRPRCGTGGAFSVSLVEDPTHSKLSKLS
jgi:hypothetical protein